MKYNRFTTALTIALATTIGAGAETPSSRDVVVLKSDNGDIITALPVLDNTVIKFAEDSIRLQKDDWTGSFPISSVRDFDYQGECFSDFRIRLSSNEISSYPFGELFVTLHNENDDEIFGIVQKTDIEGVATFRNVPAGFYTVYVNDVNERYDTFSKKNVHHGFDDEGILFLKGIGEIYFTIEPAGEELYDICLTWDASSEDDADGYNVYLNEEHKGSTSYNEFLIAQIPMGEYHVTVQDIAPDGTPAERERRIKILISDFKISGTEIVVDDEMPEIYYNLHGQTVKNPGPGIYIVNGKKVVIR